MPATARLASATCARLVLVEFLMWGKSRLPAAWRCLAFRRLVEAIGVEQIARWWTTVRSPQFRLNRFLTSCPEIISVKDNRVSGTVVTELPFATAGVLTNGG